MKIKLLTTFVILIVFNFKARSQNECSELLQYGIYNHFSLTDNVSNYSKMKSALQTIYSMYNADKKNGKVKANYNLFSGGASYTGEQIESLYRVMNSSQMTENDYMRNINIVRSTIDPNVLNAYNECRKLSSNSGLKIKASMSPDNISAISFDIYFSDEWNGLTPTVKGLDTKSVNGTDDCFTCEGDFKEIADSMSALKQNERYSLTCYRNKFKEPKKTLNGKFIVAEEGIIKIRTSMGNYTLWVPSVEQRREIPRNIGEIVVSMLSKDQFINLNSHQNWVLADGRDIGENNAYFRLTGKTKVPDLRGVFLRGRNYDRDSGQGNPEGDIAVGEFRMDKILSHSHVMPNIVYDAGGNGNAWTASARTFGFGYGNRNTKDNLNGYSETRPRNVTVNYFIRID